MEKKDRETTQYNFISDDFSYAQQILLLLRRDELPLEMNLALSDFTTISTARESEVPVLSANHCTLTINDLLRFGKMKPSNTRKKDTDTTYKWYSNKKNDRGFGKNIMSYAEELLKNASTISIPNSDSIESLIEAIDAAIENSRDIDERIFSFRFIQFFWDRINGERGNDWTSYVFNMESREMSMFDRDNQYKKQILTIVNQALEKEWTDLQKEEKRNEKFKKFGMKRSDEFKLTIFGEDEKFRNDTGLASILHSWTHTTPDIFGSPKRFNCNAHNCLNTFELMDERTVERFRQLVLFWFIGNDMDMHIYIDFRDQVTLESVGK